MAKLPPGGRTIFADDPDEDDTIEMELSPQDMQRLARAAEEQHLKAEPVESTPRSLPVEAPGAASAQSSAASRDTGSDTLEQETSAGASSATLEIEALASVASPTTARLKPPRGVSSATLGRGALAGAAGALVVVLAIASWSAAHRAPPVESAAEPGSPPVAQESPTTSSPTPTPRRVTAPAAAPAPAPELEPVRIKNPFDRSEVFEFPPGTTLQQARQSVADLLLQRARDRRMQRHPANGPGRGRSAKDTDLAQNTARAR